MQEEARSTDTKLKKEIAVFNGKRYCRYPESKHRNSRVYFQRHHGYLHRDIWESVHGKIPDGFHVHHKDENPSNNAIENLECVSASEHMSRKHTKTILWHQSERFKETWKEVCKKGDLVHAHRRENPAKLICIGCGKSYLAVNFKISKYCSNKCVVAAYKKRKKK